MRRIIHDIKRYPDKTAGTRVCEIKSVNRHSMISDGAVSS